LDEHDVGVYEYEPCSLVSALLSAQPRLGGVRVLAIDGPSGAGKSTVAAAVLGELRARNVVSALISTDDFATWDAPVSWWTRLVKGVLEPFSERRHGGYRRMDWSGAQPRLGEHVTVELPEVLILEGVSSGRASIRPSLSRLCWIAGPDAATRLERSVARDGESNRVALARWQEFERGWYAVDKTGQHAVSEV
jgi:ABC-type dipeptide/oligopeptide/nickel transport system ATPase component